MTKKPKMFELTLPGRPVPWARARQSKWGGFFTPLRQAAHRETLANIISLKMREKRLKQFKGSVGLYVEFDYATPETRLTFFEINENEYRTGRPDVDNLIKQILESAQDAGLVKDDAQIALVDAQKLK
jgi:Holliday junction resolvase RusA-like endonuclease